jgi:hypothetical protein
MTALYIFLGVIAFFFLLLIAPVITRFDYDDKGMRLSVQYLIFRFRLLPVPKEGKKDKKRRRPRAGGRRKEKAKKEKAKKTAQSYLDMGKLALELLGEARWGLRLIRRSIVFSRLKLLASIGGEDAHQAAEAYGRAAAALFPALALLGCVFTVKQPAVYLAPNFLSEKTVIEASVRVRILPLAVVVAAVNIGVKLLKALLKSKPKRTKIKSKGGKKHERTSSSR